VAKKAASARLELLPRSELQARARHAGIPGSSRLRKAELVQALRGQTRRNKSS
jgi:hypothetical protein